MPISINQYVSKGVQNINNSEIMTWWKTNFNMPVPNVWDTTVFNRYTGCLTYLDSGNSYDLSGFYAGWEAFHMTSIYDFDSVSGTYYMSAKLTRSDSSILITYPNSAPISVSLGSGEWYAYGYGFNQGVAGWEIDRNGTYEFYSWIDGAGTTSSTTNITVTNCPGTTEYPERQGYIWVGTDSYLHYYNANQFEHVIIGTLVSYVGTSSAGYMWIGTDNYLYWVGYDGYSYYSPLKIKQFASTYTNGAPGEVYAGTTYSGNIWVDNQFGWTHLSYIGYDGYKYLTGNGHDPYVSPY